MTSQESELLINSSTSPIDIWKLQEAGLASRDTVKDEEEFEQERFITQKNLKQSTFHHAPRDIPSASNVVVGGGRKMTPLSRVQPVGKPKYHTVTIK